MDTNTEGNFNLVASERAYLGLEACLDRKPLSKQPMRKDAILPYSQDGKRSNISNKQQYDGSQYDSSFSTSDNVK